MDSRPNGSPAHAGIDPGRGVGSVESGWFPRKLGDEPLGDDGKEGAGLVPEREASVFELGGAEPGVCCAAEDSDSLTGYRLRNLNR